MLKIITHILGGRLILIPLVAISTLLTSSSLGPTSFGFIASIISISSLFSITLLGPSTTLLLKKPVYDSSKSMITIQKYFVFSGFLYFSFLWFLFLINDLRVLNSEAVIYLFIAFLAGLNSFVTSYFFAIKKINIFNFHTIAPELLFFCLIFLIFIFGNLTISNVLFCWIAQASFAFVMAASRRKALKKHILNRKYFTKDYTALFFLGIQNMARDRILILIGPLAFSLEDIGKLSFYIMLVHAFTSLNGAISNLIMTQHYRFKRNPELLFNWIIILILISLLFFIVILIFNNTNFLILFHISLSQMIAISLSLCGSLLISTLIRKVYVEYDLQRFSIYQMLITIIAMVSVFFFKNILDIFTLHMLIIGLIAISIGAYMVIIDRNISSN